jgi:phosphate transport system substrate-binding protein
MAQDLDYIPMPASVVKSVEAKWSEIKDGSGKPIF